MATAPRTPTIEAVARELRDRPVSAEQIVRAILDRHAGDYPSAGPIDWPAEPRTAPIDTWLAEARELLAQEAHPELHGRAVILALALVDPPAGRALVRSGLYFELARQLTPRLTDSVTAAGLERLAEIPFVRAIDDVPTGIVTFPGPVNDIAYSPNAQLLVAGWGRGEGGWTLFTRARLREVRSWRRAAARRVGFSRDGREVIVGSDDAFRFFDLRGRELRTVPIGRQPLAIKAGIAVGDEFVYVDGRRQRPFATLVAADIAAGARAIAAADDNGTVRVWQADDGAELGSVHTGRPVDALALSGDAAHVLAVSGREATLWEVATGAELPRLVTARQGAASDPAAAGMAFAAGSHDGTRLAIGTAGGAVAIRAADTEAVMALLSHRGPITRIAWDPDDQQLAVATEARTVTLWPVGLAPARRRRLAAYSADDTSAAADLSRRLAIDPDVDALAALIAARSVQPPLSIGLFGDWGSGKTFFMRWLSRRVAELAADARDSGELQKDVSWHKRIVQIEFNAWHYAEGNLWASLVQHILDNLRLTHDEPEDLVERRKREVMDRIRAQEGTAEHARAAAERSLAEVNERRAELDRALIEARLEDELARGSPLKAVRDTVLAAVDAVVKPADHSDAGTVAELASALEETRATLTRGSEVLTPLLHAKHRSRRLLALIAVLVGAAALAWAVGQFAPGVWEALAGVAAAVAGGAEWLRRQAEWTRRRLDAVERAAAALDAPAKQLREQHELDLRRLEEEQAAAERKAAEEERKLRELERELEEATPSRMLARLIADRVASDDYRRHLGVLALVRSDFEAMSDFLRLQNDEIERFETLEQEEADGELRIGRIVLYIDDLDRCEPAQVVQVLQAVHLLLAFPLFTVVVGVDVRWVERALRLRHAELLDSEDGATPRDYLEKIFQIPFWLEPLDAGATKRMLRELLTPAAAPVRRQADGAAPAPGTLAPATDAPEGPSTDAATAPELPPPPPRDLRPASLEIGDAELDAMDELAPLLGRSPRALKRFVNTYRLIKVRAGDPVAFLRDDPPVAPYRATLLLLALATGRPHLGAQVLDAILAGTPGTVGALVDDLGAAWRDLELSALRPHAEEVVRFTFHPRLSLGSPGAERRVVHPLDE